jgi:hypothetical protein
LVLYSIYYLDDKITDSKMGGDCGTYWGSRDMHRVWWGDLKERDYLKDLDVDGDNNKWI